MKKLFSAWLVSVILAVWVYAFTFVFKQTIQFQIYAIAFVIAPISEELLYRWLPVTLGKKIDERFNFDITWILGIFANFIFIAIHNNNYPFFGNYWAFCVQGAMGLACLYVCKKYGYWYAVALHVKYNIFVHFILQKL